MENPKTCPQCGRPFTGRSLKIVFNDTEYQLCSYFCAKVLQQQNDAKVKEQKDRQREEAQNGK